LHDWGSLQESAQIYSFFCSELASHVDRLELLMRTAASGGMYKDLLSCRQVLADVQNSQTPTHISLEVVRKAIDQAHGIVEDATKA
jgi:hypothetical protein